MWMTASCSRNLETLALNSLSALSITSHSTLSRESRGGSCCSMCTSLLGGDTRMSCFTATFLSALTLVSMWARRPVLAHRAAHSLQICMASSLLGTTTRVRYPMRKYYIGVICIFNDSAPIFKNVSAFDTYRLAIMSCILMSVNGNRVTLSFKLKIYNRIFFT